jgi:hypothetical protein
MNYAMVHHNVADFAKWKTGYDSHLPARNEAGLKEIKLVHGIDNPNEVVILFEVADVARARAFATSEDLKVKMKEFGVVSVPEIVFLTD